MSSISYINYKKVNKITTAQLFKEIQKEQEEKEDLLNKDNNISNTENKININYIISLSQSFMYIVSGKENKIKFIDVNKKNKNRTKEKKNKKIKNNKNRKNTNLNLIRKKYNNKDLTEINIDSIFLQSINDSKTKKEEYEYKAKFSERMKFSSRANSFLSPINDIIKEKDIFIKSDSIKSVPLNEKCYMIKSPLIIKYKINSRNVLNKFCFYTKEIIKNEKNKNSKIKESLMFDEFKEKASYEKIIKTKYKIWDITDKKIILNKTNENEYNKDFLNLSNDLNNNDCLDINININVNKRKNNDEQKNNINNDNSNTIIKDKENENEKEKENDKEKENQNDKENENNKENENSKEKENDNENNKEKESEKEEEKENLKENINSKSNFNNNNSKIEKISIKRNPLNIKQNEINHNRMLSPRVNKLFKNNILPKKYFAYTSRKQKAPNSAFYSPYKQNNITVDNKTKTFYKINQNNSHFPFVQNNIQKNKLFSNESSISKINSKKNLKYERQKRNKSLLNHHQHSNIDLSVQDYSHNLEQEIINKGKRYVRHFGLEENCPICVALQIRNKLIEERNFLPKLKMKYLKNFEQSPLKSKENIRNEVKRKENINRINSCKPNLIVKKNMIRNESAKQFTHIKKITLLENEKNELFANKNMNKIFPCLHEYFNNNKYF